MAEECCVGRVLKSETKRQLDNSLVTLITLKMGDYRKAEEIPVNEEHIGVLEIKIKGRHAIGGERILAQYKHLPNGALMMSKYEILYDKGNVRHSDVSD